MITGYAATGAQIVALLMLDDLIVLAIGVVTLSQRRLPEQEGRWLKLISGVAMLGLAVYLIALPY